MPLAVRAMAKRSGVALPSLDKLESEAKKRKQSFTEVQHGVLLIKSKDLCNIPLNKLKMRSYVG